MRQIGETTVEPEALQSQGRHDPRADGDAHVGGCPAEQVVDHGRRLPRSGEVVYVVEGEEEGLGGVVERFEERVDEGEWFDPQRGGAQGGDRGGEVVDPGEAGGRHQVRHQARRVAVRVVDGQPQRRTVELVSGSSRCQQRRLAEPRHPRQDGHRPNIQYLHEVWAVDEPCGSHGWGHTRVTWTDHEAPSSRADVPVRAGAGPPPGESPATRPRRDPSRAGRLARRSPDLRRRTDEKLKQQAAGHRAVPWVGSAPQAPVASLCPARWGDGIPHGGDGFDGRDSRYGVSLPRGDAGRCTPGEIEGCRRPRCATRDQEAPRLTAASEGGP